MTTPDGEGNRREAHVGLDHAKTMPYYASLYLIENISSMERARGKRERGVDYCQDSRVVSWGGNRQEPERKYSIGVSPDGESEGGGGLRKFSTAQTLDASSNSLPLCLSLSVINFLHANLPNRPLLD